MSDIIIVKYMHKLLENTPKEEMLALFEKTVPVCNRRLYLGGDPFAAMNTVILYEFWEEKMAAAIHDETLREIMLDNFFDEDVYAFVDNIWDKYGDDIFVPEEEFNYEYHL